MDGERAAKPSPATLLPHAGVRASESSKLSPMTPLPAALVVAHPGHELRLYRWLEIARPLVCGVTDGSGSGRARLQSSTEILDAIGCTAGSVMGAVSDRE